MSKIVLLGVYRPPSGSASIAITKLNTLCEELVGLYNNAEIYILGDFNVNLLEQSPHSLRLKEMCAVFNLYSLVNRPTRYANTSHTQIDICFTNSQFISSAGTIGFNASDHICG